MEQKIAYEDIQKEIDERFNELNAIIKNGNIDDKKRSLLNLKHIELHFLINNFIERKNHG